MSSPLSTSSNPLSRSESSSDEHACEDRALAEFTPEMLNEFLRLRPGQHIPREWPAAMRLACKRWRRAQAERKYNNSDSGRERRLRYNRKQRGPRRHPKDAKEPKDKIKDEEIKDEEIKDEEIKDESSEDSEEQQQQQQLTPPVEHTIKTETETETEQASPQSNKIKVKTEPESEPVKADPAVAAPAPVPAAALLSPCVSASAPVPPPVVPAKALNLLRFSNDFGCSDVFQQLNAFNADPTGLLYTSQQQSQQQPQHQMVSTVSHRMLRLSASFDYSHLANNDLTGIAEFLQQTRPASEFEEQLVGF